MYRIILTLLTIGALASLSCDQQQTWRLEQIIAQKNDGMNEEQILEGCRQRYISITLAADKVL